MPVTFADDRVPRLAIYSIALFAAAVAAGLLPLFQRQKRFRRSRYRLAPASCWAPASSTSFPSRPSSGVGVGWQCWPVTSLLVFREVHHGASLRGDEVISISTGLSYIGIALHSLVDGRPSAPAQMTLSMVVFGDPRAQGAGVVRARLPAALEPQPPAPVVMIGSFALTAARGVPHISSSDLPPAHWAGPRLLRRHVSSWPADLMPPLKLHDRKEHATGLPARRGDAGVRRAG